MDFVVLVAGWSHSHTNKPERAGGRHRCLVERKVLACGSRALAVFECCQFRMGDKFSLVSF
jgi:hypothetical protein